MTDDDDVRVACYLVLDVAAYAAAFVNLAAHQYDPPMLLNNTYLYPIVGNCLRFSWNDFAAALRLRASIGMFSATR